MSSPDPYRKIAEDLSRLRAAKVEVFGSGAHRFDLRAPLSPPELAAFEERHQVKLPEDYREFLIRVGRGGAGPYYGLFALGRMDDGFDDQEWKEGDGFV